LRAATGMSAKDLGRVTHIWYPHEHPDHFSPRSLAEIPEERRAGIPVRFHGSHDGKVLRHCQSLGFVTCSRWDQSDDSWLLAEAGGTSVLDLNDCMVSTADDVAPVKREVGRVDVLATQFSISAWDGNAEEVERRYAGGRAMLSRTVLPCRGLEPRWLLPFAGFVWFCHEENYFMNSAVVPVGEVADAVARETDSEPVVLYPGDVGEVGQPPRNDVALAHWASDYASIPTRECMRAKSVPLDELETRSRRFCARLNGTIRPLRLRLASCAQERGLPTARAPGSRRAPARGAGTARAPAALAREACDLTVASDALAYAFRFLWGGVALQINGRFREHHPEGRVPLFDALSMADGMNRAEGAEARPL